jgi:hypothetical protein
MRWMAMVLGEKAAYLRTNLEPVLATNVAKP